MLSSALNWDQGPKMLPIKSQFCLHVANFWIKGVQQAFFAVMCIFVDSVHYETWHKNVLRIHISFDLIMFEMEQIGGRLVLHPTKEGQFPQDPIFLGKSLFLKKALSQGTPNKLVELKKVSKFFDGSISPRENTPQGENARSHVYATSSWEMREKMELLAIKHFLGPFFQSLGEKGFHKNPGHFFFVSV